MFPNVEYIKTILNGLKEFVSNSIKSVRKDTESKVNAMIDSLPQADWSQNDPAAKDYVKNRTHYAEKRQIDIAGVKYTATYDGTEHEEIPFALGQVWNANFETTHYDNLEVKQASDNTLYIGDLNVNQIPFYVTKTSGGHNTSWSSGMHPGKLTLTGVSGIAKYVAVHKIQEEFIPASIARLSDVKQADWKETNPSSKAYIKNKPRDIQVYYSVVASTTTLAVLPYVMEYSFVVFQMNEEPDVRFSITKVNIDGHGIKDILSCKTGKAITSDELPYCKMVCQSRGNTLVCINPC